MLTAEAWWHSRLKRCVAVGVLLGFSRKRIPQSRLRNKVVPEPRMFKSGIAESIVDRLMRGAPESFGWIIPLVVGWESMTQAFYRRNDSLVLRLPTN